MTQDDSDAELLFREQETFEETNTDVRALDVPVSDRYPDGIKYGMQCSERDEETIFRYDNFPDHPGAAHHHKHLADESVVDIEFTGVWDLYEQFTHEVEPEGGIELHLVGLNVSKAWCLAGIAFVLDGHRYVEAIEQSAKRHAEIGLEQAFTEDYAGEHWLSSFVLYLLTRNEGGIASE